jgi:hypothetical protein
MIGNTQVGFMRGVGLVDHDLEHVLVNKVFLGHSQTIHLSISHGCFHTVTANRAISALTWIARLKYTLCL